MGCNTLTRRGLSVGTWKADQADCCLSVCRAVPGVWSCRAAGQPGVCALVLHPERCSGPCCPPLPFCTWLGLFLLSTAWKPCCCSSDPFQGSLLWSNTTTGTGCPFRIEEKGDNPVAFRGTALLCQPQASCLVSHSWFYFQIGWLWFSMIMTAVFVL